jgi:hypothetical protein
VFVREPERFVNQRELVYQNVLCFVDTTMSFAGSSAADVPPLIPWMTIELQMSDGFVLRGLGRSYSVPESKVLLRMNGSSTDPTCTPTGPYRRAEGLHGEIATEIIVFGQSTPILLRATTLKPADASRSLKSSRVH